MCPPYLPGYYIWKIGKMVSSGEEIDFFSAAQEMMV
jgi:hypothetical protein